MINNFFSLVSNRLKLMPENLKSFLGLFFLLIIFYPAMFLAKAAPLTGDHWEQHYPWAYLFSQSLRHGSLPFWTDLIQAGFPIAAESQIGIFYIPNLLLYGLLPLDIAYAWMNPIHFLIGGWGTYLFSRQIGMRVPGAFMTAVLFVFGAAFSGAYYNMTSLKTIAWFPLGLFLLEKIITVPRKRHILILGGAVGMSLVAGYLQVAVFTWLIFSIYALARIIFFKVKEDCFAGASLLRLAIASFLALSIALPQILLTYELSMQSNRLGLDENYAYVGSLSPFIFSTFMNPMIQYALRGNNLYCGLIAIFFMLFACIDSESRRSYAFKKACFFIILSLLLAFGRWSPFYVALIKITGFYSFRMPAKFIGFACFGFSMLGGIGFDAIWSAVRNKNTELNISRKVAASYSGVLILYSTVVGGAFFLMTVGRDWVIRAGEFYITNFIHGKAGHPRSLENYLSDLPALIQSWQYLYSMENFENMRSLLFIPVVAGFIFWVYRKGLSRLWLFSALLFLAVDLYSYGWIDIKKDFAFYRSVKTESSSVMKVLSQEVSEGNVSRLYGFRDTNERLPLVPSMNMLYGIEDIGAYSPLVMKRYYEVVGSFGNVNDSLQALKPSWEYVVERLPFLSALGVSHVLSKRVLEHPTLKLLSADDVDKSYLYQNRNAHDHSYFVSRVDVIPEWNSLKKKILSPGFNPREELLMLKDDLPADFQGFKTDVSSDESIETKPVKRSQFGSTWEIQTNRAGFFVLTESWYPGWSVTVNGQKAEMLRAYGLFRAVYLHQAGKHRIEFIYRPLSELSRRVHA